MEDPIEINNDTVLQVQVYEKAGISYTTGLKVILRHDSDIIMVGEIRDAEKENQQSRAALSGHLVLSTLQTRDAKGAIFRLKEFGCNRSKIVSFGTDKDFENEDYYLIGLNCNHKNSQKDLF